MYLIAIKMLIGNRGKYFGIVAGVFLAALIITQQSSIFTGLMSRTFGFLTDTRYPDIWVMDSTVQFVDDFKPMIETRLLQVRSVDGVAWAVPLYKGLLKARLSDGTQQQTNVIGIDDASLVAGPPELIEGKLEDLRLADAVIVDDVGAKGRLAKKNSDGSKSPLKVGDVLELNDRRALVVGIAKVTRTFQSNPVIYTTYSRALSFAPSERRKLTFVLAKVKDGPSIKSVKDSITRITGLKAYTNEEFSWETISYFLRSTGIPINFGIAVALGFFIGCAIVGQTFYGFTIDNIKYLGTLKAMGATNSQLLKMIILQALVVGSIGYGIGVGLASMTYWLSRNSELAFRLPWQVLAVSGGAVTLICVLSAVISSLRVIFIEPAIVFRGD